jgi:diguanylate cyclase (GGDEF)-like protein/PAS domain S-box-containing protein
MIAGMGSPTEQPVVPPETSRSRGTAAAGGSGPVRHGLALRSRILSVAAMLVCFVLLFVAGLTVLDQLSDARAHREAATMLDHAIENGGAANRHAAELTAILQRQRDSTLVARLAAFAVGGGLLLFAAFHLAWRLARELERPVETLRDTAEWMAGGNWSRPVPPVDHPDFTDLAKALEKLRASLLDSAVSQRLADVVLDNMTDAVFVTSPEGQIKRINDAAARLLGWSEGDLLGRNIASVIADQDRSGFDVGRAATETREFVVVTAQGQTIPVSFSGSTLSGADPRFQGCIFVARNITDRKRAERRIRYLASYDSLTKLPNRMQFQHSLQQALARNRRAGTAVALLYLDLDSFKEVNDTFGHAAGDRALEIFSERLIQSMPREATAGRLAGDEFALFIEGLPAGESQRDAIVQMARDLLHRIALPFHLGAQELFTTASLGIAFCPRDAENTIDLIRNADAAMYHSKQNGGNAVSLYSPDMNAAAVERLMLKSKLRRAVERDELVMLYQPKVDLRSGRIVGCEALLRWRLPGHGDIPPSQFIPLAEESDLILAIGEWVLRRVCRDFRDWQRHVPRPGMVSINLSLRQLKQAEFITRCRSVFDEIGVAPDNFELEITETTLMTDARRMVRLLDELHAMGLHLAIDDFGTGYSSLSALQQFPVGTLKIDQTFVRHAAVSKDDATLVRTIIEMGRSLGLEVVAEGVETEKQLQFLRANNCHYAQGRLLGDATSAREFLDLLIAQSMGERRYAELFA